MSRSKKKLKVIPLGGLQEIGKNITVFEYGDEILVVDCGLSFPEDDMLGIDLVIPDISYLAKNKEKIMGVILTHGHEDHMGDALFPEGDKCARVWYEADARTAEVQAGRAQAAADDKAGRC